MTDAINPNPQEQAKSPSDEERRICLEWRKQRRSTFFSHSPMFQSALYANHVTAQLRAEIVDLKHHIDGAYDALGDVNRGVYLFDHIFKLKEKIEKLEAEIHRALEYQLNVLAPNYQKLRGRAELAEAENATLETRCKVLEEALENLFKACALADSVEELPDQVDGSLLDAARKAAEKEEKR